MSAVVALDARRAARNFSAAAPRYEQAAQLQATTRAQLLEQLGAQQSQARCIVDLGCGTGLAVPLLRERYPDARVIGLDRAAGMIDVARGTALRDAVVADAQALPFAAASVDLLYANLSLQWCPRPQAALREAARVLRPDGLLAMAVPGPATLQELRLAWRQIDDDEHVHRFAPLDRWLAQASAAGLVLADRHTALYRPRHRDALALMQSLRDIGAVNASTARRQRWLGKSALARLEAAYAPRHADGTIAASWEIFYLLLRRPP
ncbi:methyltransferase domain-containing protein [Solimonas soli]|uniref:methyltransferase domain-containing protein n=1 Tax=Solimonas soli TaxID=413479 RepID=UPI0004AE5FCD|nr:methyltransferase domain-containing protein [Solimonas soli]